MLYRFIFTPTDQPYGNESDIQPVIVDCTNDNTPTPNIAHELAAIYYDWFDSHIETVGETVVVNRINAHRDAKRPYATITWEEYHPRTYPTPKDIHQQWIDNLGV